MSSATPSGKPRSFHHAAADFRGRGISWSIICLALCTVVGLTIAYYFTDNFVFALISATILRAVGLCAIMVPALFRGKTFRLERRRTFALLCLLSLISVVVAWVLWHTHPPNWPRVLLTVSDIFSVVAGVQLAISDAYEHTLYEDKFDMNEG
jgi:Na+/proline symporter